MEGGKRKVKKRTGFAGTVRGRLILSALCLIFLSACVLAQAAPDDPITVIKNRINEIVCTLFNIVLYVSAGIAAIMIIFAGIKYLSADNPVDTDKAKKMIVYAFTGLIIIFITCPVIDYLVANTKIVPFQKSCNCFPGVPAGQPTTTTVVASVTTTPVTGGGVDIGKIVEVFCRVLNLFVAFSAMIAPLMIILAGVKYLTAGDAMDREKSKQMIVSTFTGLIIVFIACPAVSFVVNGLGIASSGSCNCLIGAPGGGPTTTTTPGGPTTTPGGQVTTSSGGATTSSPTTTSPLYLTAKNLVDCINDRGILQTNDVACKYCEAIEYTFNETRSPPVGPGRPEYERLKKKINPSGSPCGAVPCWSYGVKHVGGCMNFKELNTFYECGLIEYGTPYMCCIPPHTWSC